MLFSDKLFAEKHAVLGDFDLLLKAMKITRASYDHLRAHAMLLNCGYVQARLATVD
jgi:hypothetical protein